MSPQVEHAVQKNGVNNNTLRSISDYLSNTNVQLGASYTIGRKSTDLYYAGYEAAAKYINASPSEVVIGSATTQLFRNLSSALDFAAGDELVLCAFNHEANSASWVDVAARLNLTVKWWGVPAPDHNPQLRVADLQTLLTPRTKLVAIPHVSNILGTLHDVAAIAAAVHAVPGALLCVDGVAFAPHGRVDVRALGVDFYAFSWYKVSGQRRAAFARADACRCTGRTARCCTRRRRRRSTCARWATTSTRRRPSTTSWRWPARRTSWRRRCPRSSLTWSACFRRRSRTRR